MFHRQEAGRESENGEEDGLHDPGASPAYPLLCALPKVGLGSIPPSSVTRTVLW